MIFEVKEYVDDEGRQITERISLGVCADPVVRYGCIYINTPQGQIPFQFKFDKELSREECFRLFEEKAQAALEEAQREAQKEMKSQIITPNSVSDGGIITP